MEEDINIDIDDGFVEIDIWDSLENYRLLEQHRSVTTLDMDTAELLMFVAVSIQNEEGCTTSANIPKDMADSCRWIEVIEEDILI